MIDIGYTLYINLYDVNPSFFLTVFEKKLNFDFRYSIFNDNINRTKCPFNTQNSYYIRNFILNWGYGQVAIRMAFFASLY